MICETCKFANWRRTDAGRLHPSGEGRCTWRKTFRVSGSTAGAKLYTGFGEPITAIGGHISRKKGAEFPAKCDTFQRQTD